MTTDAQAALAQVREALADPMLFDWARDWDRARAIRAFERSCTTANIAAILAHVDAQAAEIELLRAERDDLLTKLDVESGSADVNARERDELRRQLAEAGESIAAQARTIADLRGALIESREMIRVDRESLYETSANPDGTIDRDDDRRALAEYDDHLEYIAQVLGECVPVAMGLTRPAGPRG